MALETNPSVANIIFLLTKCRPASFIYEGHELAVALGVEWGKARRIVMLARLPSCGG
jgi:hypothetical protein